MPLFNAFFAEISRLFETMDDAQPILPDLAISRYLSLFRELCQQIPSLSQKLVVFNQFVLRATIRAFRFAGIFDWQEHFRMRIPQVHAWHWAGQRQVAAAYLVSVLRICRDQIFFDIAGSGRHF